MFDHFLSLSYGGLTTAALILVPVLAASLIVGLLVGILQAATQIQDLTLSFLPKMAALVVILYLAGPFFLRALTNYAAQDFGGLWRMLGP
ncbi:MAG: flagellar type III secretion system protein FliQ [Firmicutes bacterium]|nr:flagellar biosynthetic protein FliQ [Alicyclobacillaceae bacterium]MCL6497302.1 flagellar type III secretion system protein FliQ [Bacillota bacterium]